MVPLETSRQMGILKTWFPLVGAPLTSLTDRRSSLARVCLPSPHPLAGELWVMVIFTCLSLLSFLPGLLFLLFFLFLTLQKPFGVAAQELVQTQAIRFSGKLSEPAAEKDKCRWKGQVRLATIPSNKLRQIMVSFHTSQLIACGQGLRDSNAQATLDVTESHHSL